MVAFGPAQASRGALRVPPSVQPRVFGERASEAPPWRRAAGSQSPPLLVRFVVNRRLHRDRRQLRPSVADRTVLILEPARGCAVSSALTPSRPGPCVTASCFPSQSHGRGSQKRAERGPAPSRVRAWGTARAVLERIHPIAHSKTSAGGQQSGRKSSAEALSVMLRSPDSKAAVSQSERKMPRTPQPSPTNADRQDLLGAESPKAPSAPSICARSRRSDYFDCDVLPCVHEQRPSCRSSITYIDGEIAASCR